MSTRHLDATTSRGSQPVPRPLDEEVLLQLAAVAGHTTLVVDSDTAPVRLSWVELGPLRSGIRDGPPSDARISECRRGNRRIRPHIRQPPHVAERTVEPTKPVTESAIRSARYPTVENFCDQSVTKRHNRMAKHPY